MSKLNKFGLKKGGHTTRYVHTDKGLRKFVYTFPSSSSKKKFRVCRKIDGDVVTFGYFKTPYEANQFSKACFGWT